MDMNSRMRAEALEGPATVRRLLAADTEALQRLVHSLVHRPPSGLLTVARGTSDHAAHYAAYLVMARLGVPVTSLPMSLLTLYQSPLRTQGVVSLAFSQSGRSPDLITPTRALRDAGARTVAFVNDPQSPLAKTAEWVFDLQAGPETSVAATKSCLAQLVSGARLVAHWLAAQQGEPRCALGDALQVLPDALERATTMDWSPALEALTGVDRLYVIGRGPTLAVAQEAALKLKETCGLQAEAFSSAEVRHGPMALAEPGFPVLVLATPGPAQADALQLATEWRARGVRVLLAAPLGTPGVDLPLATAPHDDLAPIVALQSHYLMAEALARARGRNPDTPPHLSKVTLTE
jgi:glutamine---fructose-6-phosphate transaminase (isomerizing)